MVDYEYQELFYNHSRVDILIVESGASLIWNSTTHQFDVTGSSFVLRTEDVEMESFDLDEKICSYDNLKFGLCQSAHLSIIFYNKTTIPNLDEKYISVMLYFDGDPETIFAVGEYLVDEDNYSAGRTERELSAYDLLYTANNVDITEWYNKYFDDGNRHMIGLAILSLFNFMKDEDDEYETSPNLPLTLESGYNLCNGTYQIGKTIESDTITFGYFMSGVLEWNGAFGHIGRNGKFQIITLASTLDTEPVRVITDSHRFPPTNYDDVNTWGIGGIDVYDRTNVRKFKYRNTNKKHPSIYVLRDPWVIADRKKGDADTKAALKKFHDAIQHQNYNPSETECIGDLCVEVGDFVRINFANPIEGDTRTWFRSYVLERHCVGLQGMLDTYSAKGDKKQPKYTITNDRWHTGDSTDSSTQGEGGVSSIDAEEDRKLIAKQRNYGEPMLDEPTDVEVVYNKSSQQVEIKWTDPDDIDTYTPLPVEWEGTVVVRKEGSPPLHPFGNIDEYGGTIIETETTKNSYQDTAFVDDTIEPNKKYYYAIMPYFVKLDDAEHPVNQYRWTKVVSVDTERILTAPTIYPIQDSQISGTTVTVAYTIPTLEDGTYTVKKLVVKKGSIPLDKTDGDVIIDLTPDPTMLINGVEVSGLDENSTYYFVIFIEDEIGSSASSEPQSAETGVDEGWNYDYTGQIQTFVAPKTGIYQLETWGAQGGDATDGTNTARGGYGAYAYGEVLLQQGDTIYINVGGQNGYGGGGNWQTEEEEMIYSTNEQIVGTYLDETLYQCTFNISSVSGASSRTYINLVDLSSYNIKRIVSFEGSWSDGTMYKPFTWADTSSIIGDITYNVNSKYLQLLNSGFDQASFYDVSITIRYTKNS